LLRKFQKYLEAGVREYWVIDPESGKVQVYILNGGSYRAGIYTGDSAIPVSVLPGLAVELKSVFEE
jgi:Uma2 family endonuclease